ncbi:kelch-like protein 10 [Bacillus rossius redtenbacheri]|uniref:kelch-like protein 10 n=1 Tax=Bacillus rossius redtenbacheri TaxID=93214 RepID=UPI002FDD9279
MGDTIREGSGSRGTATDALSKQGARSMSIEALEILHDLRRNNQLCDAIIRLEDGGSFPVHRAILSACSPYFRALFTTAIDVPRDDVLIHGISTQVMALILNYAYVRNISINKDNVRGLLVAADYLCVEGALELCCDFLKKTLSAKNCVDVIHFASFYTRWDLAAAARNYLMREFVSVCQESKELLETSLDELCAIISCDELNAKKEESVWECVVRWIEHRPGERRRYIAQLLGCVRLGLMETQYFVKKVKGSELVAGNQECRPLVIDALTYLYDVQTQSDDSPVPDIARPRYPHEVLLAIGGWSGGSPTTYMESYDCRADWWIPVYEVDPAGARAYHGTAVMGFDIYIIGGFNGIDYFNSCRCFNMLSRTWREVAPMNARRCYVSVVVLGSHVYAIGGYDGHARQSSAERYNPATNQWSPMVPMTIERSDACATILDGRIYITGGFTGQDCLNSAEYYDPELNQWIPIPNMSSRRSGVSCVAYRGCLYVVGGFNSITRLSSAEMYNPATNTWTRIADMVHPRSNFALKVVDDAIYAVGGFNGVTTIAKVDCYDERVNEWYEVSEMNIFRSALSAAVISDLPNIHDYIRGKSEDRNRKWRRQAYQHTRRNLNQFNRFTVVALRESHDSANQLVVLTGNNNEGDNSDDDDDENNFFNLINDDDGTGMEVHQEDEMD